MSHKTDAVAYAVLYIENLFKIDLVEFYQQKNTKYIENRHV
jgi:hypothetical protein